MRFTRLWLRSMAMVVVPLRSTCSFPLPPRNLPLRLSAAASPFHCRGSAGEVSVTSATPPPPPPSIIPLSNLPKGERQLLSHQDTEVLLLWHQDDVYAIENSSPADGGGLVNAQVTQDGCIVCPSSGSTFYLKNGDLKEWFPGANPLMRILTPPLKNLTTYPVKMDAENIYINTYEECADAVLLGEVPAEKSLLGTFLEEDIELELGFTPDNEIINGRAAMVGFSVMLFFELTSGQGVLKGIGFLDFLYQYLPGFPVLKY